MPPPHVNGKLHSASTSLAPTLRRTKKNCRVTTPHRLCLHLKTLLYSLSEVWKQKKVLEPKIVHELLLHATSVVREGGTHEWPRPLQPHAHDTWPVQDTWPVHDDGRVVGHVT